MENNNDNWRSDELSPIISLNYIMAHLIAYVNLYSSNKEDANRYEKMFEKHFNNILKELKNE